MKMTSQDMPMIMDEQKVRSPKCNKCEADAFILIGNKGFCGSCAVQVTQKYNKIILEAAIND